MMKYAFYFTTSKSGGEGKVNTQTAIAIDRQIKLYRTDIQTYRNR